MREHALPAEHAIEADTVEPACQGALASLVDIPAFDRVGQPQPVEVLVACLDAVADPAVAAVLFARRGASLDHLGESDVASDGIAPAPQCLSERAGEVKAIQRQYRAQAGLHPEDVRVVAPVRHREDAATVCEHQQLVLYDGRADGRVHGKQPS